MNSSEEDTQDDVTIKDGETETLAKSSTFPGAKTFGMSSFMAGAGGSDKGAKPFLKIPPINVKPPAEQKAADFSKPVGTPPPFRPLTSAGILEGTAADTEKKGNHLCIPSKGLRYLYGSYSSGGLFSFVLFLLVP